MILHLCHGHDRPSAAIGEVAHQVAGREPRLTVGHLSGSGPVVALLTEGLARPEIVPLL